MHDTENLVDAVLRECVRLFRCQQDAVKLFKKRICFI